MTTPAKQLIIYDLDGTLVDTLQDIAGAVAHMLARLQAPPMSAQQVRRHVGRGLAELIRSCLKTDEPARLAAGLEIYRAYYARHLLDHSTLYPGVREVLEHFRGRRQVVLTNKPNPYSRDLLTGLGIAGYFAQIIGGDGTFPRKPDPTSLRALLRAAAVGPEAALVVGDSPIDVEAGRRAGIFTVAVSQGLADEEELRAAAPGLLVRDFPALLARARAEGW